MVASWCPRSDVAAAMASDCNVDIRIDRGMEWGNSTIRPLIHVKDGLNGGEEERRRFAYGKL